MSVPDTYVREDELKIDISVSGRLWWVDSHSQGAEGAMGDNRAKQRCKRLCWQLTI